MAFRRLLLAGAATAALALFSLTPSRAITVATFGQQSKNNTFTYNQGTLGPIPDATMSVAAGTKVTFTFSSAFGGVLAGKSFTADLTLTGFSASPISSTTGVASQFVTLPTIAFTYADPAGDVAAGTNVLTVNALPGFPGTGGILSGLIGSRAAATIGSQPGDNIVYTSAVDPNIATTLNRSYSLSFSDILPPLAAEGGFNQDFKTFAGNISGNFGGEATVPEPGVLAMFVGMGVTGSLFGFRLRRRA